MRRRNCNPADPMGAASWVLVWRALVGGVSVKELTAGPVGVDIGRAVRTGSVSVVEPTVSVMRSAGRLVVDPRIHADEIARFTSHIVRGPTASDCDIWISAIGADGYGRYYLTRQGMGLCVRPHRYALAMAAGALAAGVLGLHECDNPVCVKVAADGEIEHVVAGSQGDNMDRMVKMRRGGGRYLVRRGDSRVARRERSVALREAVRHGWDAAAVEAALLGNQPTLW
jgi:hypothetical protein